PRSSNAARMAENLNVFDFALTDEEMTRIAALKRPDGRIANPVGRAPAWEWRSRNTSGVDGLTRKGATYPYAMLVSTVRCLLRPPVRAVRGRCGAVQVGRRQRRRQLLELTACE